MQNMAGRKPFDPKVVAVYNIKSFSVAPVGSIQECYIPMDIDGCFGASNAPDEQLIYWCAWWGWFFFWGG